MVATTENSALGRFAAAQLAAQARTIGGDDSLRDQSVQARALKLTGRYCYPNRYPKPFWAGSSERKNHGII
jgi:hypothetical protein